MHKLACTIPQQSSHSTPPANKQRRTKATSKLFLEPSSQVDDGGPKLRPLPATIKRGIEVFVLLLLTIAIST